MPELEAIIEQKLIEELVYGDSQWIYREDLKTEEDLWGNFRYILEQNNKEKAKECLDFVINSASQHGFLAEQIDNNTMQPAWVIGLGWSHAMFIILLNQMFN